MRRLVCWVKRRHSIEKMRADRVQFHQIAGISGGGYVCVCSWCGKRVYFTRPA